MVIIGRPAAALAVGLALAATTPVAAETRAQAAAEAPPAQVSVSAGRITGDEARDLRTLEAAMRDVNRHGYPGLTRHIPALKVALNRAPASYGIVDRTSPNRWIVRTDDLGQTLILATMAGAMGGGTNIEILRQTNVYGTIAMMLGSEAVDRHVYAEAVAYLDQGLAFQPDNGLLTAEKASAMQALGQHEAVLVMIEAALPQMGPGATVEQAMLYRRRGASLIELGRLDEARTAFERSIEILPDNPVAHNELAYIRQLPAGEARQPLTLVATPVATTPPAQ